MFSSASYLACLLVIVVNLTTVSALPVPNAGTSVGQDVSSLRVPGSAGSASHRVAGLTRRSIKAPPAPSLRIVDEEEADMSKVDMRDPRNWIIRSTDSTSASAATTVQAQKVATPSTRRFAKRDSRDDSIFKDDDNTDDDTLFPSLQVAHVLGFDVADTDSSSSLEPNGIHASLAAAMAVRQIEQRQEAK
ncbi:hypothetical protein JCM3774_002116 [Rhodotorula dairenensis]